MCSPNWGVGSRFNLPHSAHSKGSVSRTILAVRVTYLHPANAAPLTPPFTEKEKKNIPVIGFPILPLVTRTNMTNIPRNLRHVQNLGQTEVMDKWAKFQYYAIRSLQDACGNIYSHFSVIIFYWNRHYALKARWNISFLTRSISHNNGRRLLQ